MSDDDSTPKKPLDLDNIKITDFKIPKVFDWSKLKLPENFPEKEFDGLVPYEKIDRFSRPERFAYKGARMNPFRVGQKVTWKVPADPVYEGDCITRFKAEYGEGPFEVLTVKDVEDCRIDRQVCPPMVQIKPTVEQKDPDRGAWLGYMWFIDAE